VTSKSSSLELKSDLNLVFWRSIMVVIICGVTVFAKIERSSRILLTLADQREQWQMAQ
jgi:hypothetical protein